MARLDWHGEASLMRVTDFRSADTQEELVARGTLTELVGQAIGMPAAQQQGLMIRQAGADWVEEHDADTIRELAARPEFTGADGAYDTADRPHEADEEQGGPFIEGAVSGPDETDARGRDGER